MGLFGRNKDDDKPVPATTKEASIQQADDVSRPEAMFDLGVRAEEAGDLVEARSWYVKAADHDNQAMPLRIGAMERELERLQLVSQLAGRAAETAHDHRQAADYAFLWGENEYSVPEDEENLHTHRRWRLKEQAKASETSREIESRAAREAVRRMTHEVDEIKAGTDRVEAKATLAIEEAKAAMHLAKLARAAADAAA